MIRFIEMHGFYYALLWFRDILVWIWIRGSRSLTYGSGFGSCFLHKWLTRCQHNFFFRSNLLIHKSSKIKKSKRSHKIVKSRFFLLFLHVDGFYGMVCWFLWVVCSMGGKNGVWVHPLLPTPPTPCCGGRGERGIIMPLGEEGGVRRGDISLSRAT